MLAEIDKWVSSKINSFKSSMTDKKQNTADEQLYIIEELQNVTDSKF